MVVIENRTSASTNSMPGASFASLLRLCEAFAHCPWLTTTRNPPETPRKFRPNSSDLGPLNPPKMRSSKYCALYRPRAVKRIWLTKNWQRKKSENIIKYPQFHWMIIILPIQNGYCWVSQRPETVPPPKPSSSGIGAGQADAPTETLSQKCALQLGWSYLANLISTMMWV